MILVQSHTGSNPKPSRIDSCWDKVLQPVNKRVLKICRRLAYNFHSLVLISPPTDLKI